VGKKIPTWSVMLVVTFVCKRQSKKDEGQISMWKREFFCFPKRTQREYKQRSNKS